jgi:hypothetical protein
MAPVQGSIMGREVAYADFLAHLALPGALLGMQSDLEDASKSRLMLHVPDAAGVWRHHMLCWVATAEAPCLNVDLSASGQFATCLTLAGDVEVFDLCSANPSPLTVHFPANVPKPCRSLLSGADDDVITFHDGPLGQSELNIVSPRKDPIGPPGSPSRSEGSAPEACGSQADTKTDSWLMVSRRQGQTWTCAHAIAVENYPDLTVSHDGSLLVLSSVYDLSVLDFNGSCGNGR